MPVRTCFAVLLFGAAAGCGAKPEPAPAAPPDEALTPEVAKDSLLRMMRSKPGQDLGWFKGDVPDEMANALTLAGSGDNVRRRIEAYREAGLTGVMLNPSPPGGYFPLYEGHFPEDVELPAFDFPGFMSTLDATVELLGMSA